ncbi:hypothetical protein ABZ553_11915 [Streptomyces sparsogenes]|uniref:hypothetical protein n=1 Tax=Streptomyces sparsogenes TaxID=67365 RepID=UPI0033E3C1B8
MTVVLAGERLVETARGLREADTGGWRESALRALVSSFGWRWRQAAGDAGEAWLRPTGRYESPFAHDGEEFVGLHVPVELVEGGAAAKAESFRRAAEALTEAFGRASIMGAYGGLGPFYESTPQWGSPFLRWRGKPDTLELRAGERGPELLLQPTDPVENWFWRQGHGEDFALGGFFGSLPVPANGGLGLPGYWRTDDWDVYTTALSDFLGSLPAATSALGIELDLGIHADVPGTYGPVVFHISSGERLEIAHGPGLAGLDPGGHHSRGAVPLDRLDAPLRRLRPGRHRRPWAGPAAGRHPPRTGGGIAEGGPEPLGPRPDRGRLPGGLLRADAAGEPLRPRSGPVARRLVGEGWLGEGRRFRAR